MRSFTAPGDPVPQGGMKAFAVKGKAFTTNINAGPLARYRNDIRNAYGQVYGMEKPYHGPVEVYVSFFFKRPKHHYNTNGKLKDSDYKTPAPRWVTKKPDIDKVSRALLDALTEYAYYDDSQVVSLNAVMQYAERASTDVRVIPMTDQPLV